MSNGWALGSEKFKANLMETQDVPDSCRAWGAIGAKEVRSQRQKELLAVGLQTLEKNENDLKSGTKSAPWKIAIARFLKEKAQADNRWLGETLSIGRPEAVSTYIGRMKRGEIDDLDYRKLKTTIV